MKCCSAPGKVLVTGGYLVLDRPNTGIVLTVNARFYTSIQALPASATEKHGKAKIIVISPQFNSKLEYIVQWEPTIKLEKINTAQKENKYIERTLLASFICVAGQVDTLEFSKFMGRGLVIHIVGDNQFYSMNHQLKLRQLTPTANSLQTLPRFLEVQSGLEDIPKTGLGSSAALVSSLTGAVLTYFGVVNLSNGTQKDLAHNLAQLSHCSAQGKVGSGFDVSSAVYGSQVYKRFSSSVLTNLLKQFDDGSIDSQTLLAGVDPSVSPGLWDNEHKPFSLPPGIHLMLADVGVGSNTPGMVRTILQWNKDNPIEAKNAWDELNRCNLEVEDHLVALHLLAQNDRESYLAAIHTCSELPPDQWVSSGVNTEVGQRLWQVREKYRLGVRGMFRKIGELAQVPLEPPSQTRLTDASTDVLGCLFAGVPGAGGFDAIFAIVLSPTAVRRVEELWETWKETQVLPLILQEDFEGLQDHPQPPEEFKKFTI